MLERLHRLLIRVYRALPLVGRLFVVRRLAPSFTVGAICVVERSDGSMLCVRHSYRRGWGLPGGLLQRGEEGADGARREVLEEVGLEVELVSEPSVVVDPRPRRVDLIFRARPVDGADLDGVRPRSPEITEIGWFAPDALPELQHEAAGALVALARSTGAPGTPDGANPHRPPPGRS